MAKDRKDYQNYAETNANSKTILEQSITCSVNEQFRERIF
jgi:hypothetical protein